MLYLHSTMVLLVPAAPGGEGNNASKFTFHYGSISTNPDIQK